VLSIDRFGNVITDVRGTDLPPGSVVVECRGHRMAGLVRTYEEGHGLVALVGSSGYMEMALPRGNAAAEIGAAIGDVVLVRPE
jgi:S-adenosyl-L-methionine hydrolase (adenosine-forming)